MLTDPRLSLFTGDEEDICSADERPQNKLTEYTIYDKLGHLCSFDTGLIEKNKELYFSGYVKPIYDENSSPEGEHFNTTKSCHCIRGETCKFPCLAKIFALYFVVNIPSSNLYVHRVRI